MKCGFDLQIGDTLYRPQFSEWCTIKGITTDTSRCSETRYYEFNGFMVNSRVLVKMFDNVNGKFILKGDNCDKLNF